MDENEREEAYWHQAMADMVYHVVGEHPARWGGAWRGGYEEFYGKCEDFYNLCRQKCADLVWRSKVALVYANVAFWSGQVAPVSDTIMINANDLYGEYADAEECSDAMVSTLCEIYNRHLEIGVAAWIAIRRGVEPERMKKHEDWPAILADVRRMVEGTTQ